MNDEGLFGGTLVGMHPRGQRRYAYWPYYLTTHFYSERETDRQTDGQTDRQTERQKDKQTDRQTIYIPKEGARGRWREPGAEILRQHVTDVTCASMGDNEFH